MADGRLSLPYGDAVDTAGNVYVADTENHRVQKFSPTGALIDVWGKGGVDPGTFDTLYGITVGGDGRVYVADTNNHRVQTFNTNGDLLGVIGEWSPNPGHFMRPRGVAGQGRFLRAWGTQGNGADQFNCPSAITIDRNGAVSVADTYNSRVARMGSDTTPPETTHTLTPPPNADGWHNGDVAVALSVTDNVGAGGVQSLTYSASGAPALAATTVPGAAASVVIEAEGATTVSYGARDIAGNVEATKTAAIKIDRTAPTTTVGLAPSAGATGWYAEPVTIDLAAADAGGSGVKEIVYSAADA